MGSSPAELAENEGPRSQKETNVYILGVEKKVISNTENNIAKKQKTLRVKSSNNFWSILNSVIYVLSGVSYF